MADEETVEREIEQSEETPGAPERRPPAGRAGNGRGPGFLLGMVLGMIAGAAAAALFAPPTEEEETQEAVTGRGPAAVPAEGPSAEAVERVRSVLARVRARVREAREEGRLAAREAEAEGRARYAELTGQEQP